MLNILVPKCSKSLSALAMYPRRCVMYLFIGGNVSSDHLRAPLLMGHI